MPNVLVTDVAWRDLNIEESILKRAGATLIAASTGNEDELLSLAPDVDGILTCWKVVSGKVIRSAPKCIAIGRFGIGLDNIDVNSATDLGIIVTNVPSYCIDEVSDHAMALLLSCARRTAFFDRSIKAGIYDLQSGTPLYRLKGRILGIVGFGKIGRAVSTKARAFGLEVIAYDPHLHGSVFVSFGVEQVGFIDLVRRSDFVSIHAPLAEDTTHLFDDDVFQQMKPTSILINTSRGKLVNPKALLTALNRDLIAGAGLDVLPAEPPMPGDPLVNHPKVVVTPHAAFNSEESLVELRQTTALQMVDVLTGRCPGNIVNPEVLKRPNLRWCGSRKAQCDT
jgi:D-3-phosphoglycerate dehydrogenase